MLPSETERSRTPAYDLEEVQRLVGQGPISCRVSQVALYGGRSIGLGSAEIVDVVLSLKLDDFYKSMPSELIPGLWQDVYHVSYAGRALYVKVQINREGNAVVIQCKKR